MSRPDCIVHPPQSKDTIGLIFYKQVKQSESKTHLIPDCDNHFFWHDIHDQDCACGPNYSIGSAWDAMDQTIYFRHNKVKP